ncbi:hypothetical protein IM538_12660 [Cytobacillus suaedae]|nr:hypothetical protein IM538_12660 [Cytobacillus suaedae]
MQVNYETSVKTNIQTKKSLTLRAVLNYIGVFLTIGMLLTIFTVPLSLNEELQFYYNTDLLLKKYKLTNFIAFSIGFAVIYFLAVNVYYMWWAKQNR